MKRRRKKKPVPNWSTDIYLRPNAGFAHAMLPNQKPITVQRLSFDISPALDYWNRLAGWTLFSFGDPYEVTIDFLAGDSPDPLVRGNCLCSDETPYTGCHINMWFASTDAPTVWRGTLIHELGHALGFAHLEEGVMRYMDTMHEAYDTWILQQAGYRA